MESTQKINVLIVDDHQMSSLGTKAMLMPDESIVVAGIARNGLEALDMLATRPVDIVLLDVLMPGMDGFETLAVIKKKFPRVKVIMLTAAENKETIARVVSMKAEGFVFKDVMDEELIKAVHKVFNGDYHYNMRVFDVILSDMSNTATPARKSGTDVPDGEKAPGREVDVKSVIERLTHRELEVLKMIGRGMATKDIAEELNISKFTVSTYRKNLYSKLEIESLSALLAIAKKLI